MNYETMKEAEFAYIEHRPDLGGHVLENLSEPNKRYRFELWIANKNHASYGLIFKNTHLEFALSLSGVESLARYTDPPY